METLNSFSARRVPWNKGRLTGQKPPLKLREIWAIRTRLQMSSNVRELALFNLAIDSKLRACDLTRLQVQDICMGSHVVSRATFMQQKRNYRCNSKSRTRLGRVSQPGLGRFDWTG
ncbi:phage integrase [Caballeronia terrestris]|uniref:Phage integrase n=1 Tax=Caballeronia terrestris TaxID=1226301 RepID=A0A158KQS7_9BURK|nr:phage integrase [Caballeronia terrestris]